MKKILLLAAAVTAIFSCSKTDIDELLLSDVNGNLSADGTMRTITINASLDEDDSQTRMALDDGWGLTWETGDALMAWSNDGGDSTNKLSNQDESFDAASVTFEGDIPAESPFRLLYPYDADAAIEGGEYTIDISSQAEGGSDPYMVNDDILAQIADEYNVMMRHIGAAVVLNLTFPSSDYSDKTITSVKVKGFNSGAVVELTKAITDESFYCEYISGDITVRDGATTIDSDKAAVRFNIRPSMVAIISSSR